MKLIIKVSEGQTFLDLAMQYLGDVMRADEIAVLNGLALTEDLAPGTEIEIPAIEADKTPITAAFSERGLIPASRDEDFVGDIDDGIDYWYIEVDFIVQ